MKGTVVFDLDYTLFDTTLFKAVLAEHGEASAAVRMPEFVFPGAFSVLDRLKAQGWKLALLTLGEPGWQEDKVRRAGLMDRFDYAVFTAKPKAECIAEFAPWPRPLVFVNDHGGEMDMMRHALPEATCIVLRSHKPAPSEPSIPVYETLEEIYHAIV